MFKERIKSHELSERHYRQVLCRPRVVREQMSRIWAATWRPGDRTGTFLGKLFRPEGSPLMMVQASDGIERGRERIGLFGVAAQIQPQDGTVTYDNYRMKHDFGRLPYVGAHGVTLDPSDDRPGQRAHGSWVRLALDVDRVRHRLLNRQWLPQAPQLPEIYFAYHRKEDAPFEATPALQHRAIGYDGPVLGGNFSDNIAAAREKAFGALPEEARLGRLHDAWDAAFIPPEDPANTTGFWLLPQELSRNVFATSQIFEYFGRLVGANLYNPARELAGRSVSNPATQIATEAGIDLASDLALLADTAQGEAGYEQIEERLLALVPLLRTRIRASDALTDEDLLRAICAYDQPVVIEPPLQTLSEAEQVAALRRQLAPHHSECCSDRDLLNGGIL